MADLRTNARLVVDELVANGASLTYRASSGAMPASFTYEIAGEGSRHRCRQIIATAKADPLLWSAVIREIAERSREAA